MGREIYRLYSRPTFLEGIARLFDFGGLLNQYNYSKSDQEADFRAIKSDWQHVGEYMSQAIKEFDQIQGENRS